MFVWLLVACFVANGAFSVCAPILPVELGARGVPGGYIGLTFTAYSVGIVFWSPVVGKYLVGRYAAHNLLGGSLAVLGVSFMCLGLIVYLRDSTTILIVTCVLRTIQGIAGTTQTTTGMAMLAKHASPDTKDKWLGYYTSLWGVGSMTGPILGSALYSMLGFEKMLYVYGGLELLFALFLRHKIKHCPPTPEKPTNSEELIS